ncbi:MAG: hypothetical protein KA795_05955 [Burkholderiaceae bacterium]|nr:hypothetical protein [Burkholderiaceae bacterium]
MNDVDPADPRGGDVVPVQVRAPVVRRIEVPLAYGLVVVEECEDGSLWVDGKSILVVGPQASAPNHQITP